jgi:LCP family protein required for cell wall assembly
MARQEKPYRVYRGGRAKGKVPLQRRVERVPATDGRPPTTPSRPPRAKPKRRPNWGRRIGVGLLILTLLLVAWLVASYLALASGMQEANDRLGAVPLDQQDGLLISKPTNILLLGTDHGPGAGRDGARRSDSIMLVRTDPERGRIAYLSIPRDLRVDIPGRGPGKINAAYPAGGPGLAIRTVREYTGLPVNHVAVVDFQNFERLIDALGGVTVNVPERIVSNRFDCPYATQQQCERWGGWHFEPGRQEMDGRRALIYSRIRENQLNPTENDLTRGERQQSVVRAIADELTSPLTALKLPFLADDLAAPLATDLTGGQFLQLGWRKLRASDERTLRCRLGGTPSQVGGESVLIGSEENRNVILMFMGAAAPQPPPPGSGPFGPGCTIGG